MYRNGWIALGKQGSPGAAPTPSSAGSRSSTTGRRLQNQTILRWISASQCPRLRHILPHFLRLVGSGRHRAGSQRCLGRLGRVQVRHTSVNRLRRRHLLRLQHLRRLRTLLRSSHDLLRMLHLYPRSRAPRLAHRLPITWIPHISANDRSLIPRRCHIPRILLHLLRRHHPPQISRRLNKRMGRTTLRLSCAHDHLRHSRCLLGYRAHLHYCLHLSSLHLLPRHRTLPHLSVLQ